IWTYSEIGKGTTFEVYLPALLEPDTGRQPPPPFQPERLSGTETVPVLEDEDVVRATVITMLSKSGYTVFEANSPQEALRRLIEHTGPIHLLLSDVVKIGRAH